MTFGIVKAASSLSGALPDWVSVTLRVNLDEVQKPEAIYSE